MWVVRRRIPKAPKSRKVSTVSLKHIMVSTFGRKIVDSLHSDISQKSITGRAYFLDWYRYITTTRPELDIDATTSYAILISQTEETAAHQGFSLSCMRPGDIIIIRFGYLSQYASMPFSMPTTNIPSLQHWRRSLSRAPPISLGEAHYSCSGRFEKF